MRTTKFLLLLVSAAILSVFSACQKGANTKTGSLATTTATVSGATAAAVVSTGAIAITTTSALASINPSTLAIKDSVYLVNCYPPHGKKDSVAFSTLPSAIGTYLTANYSGYTFTKAYQVTDSTKTVINYIVVIKYNNNLIGIKFTAAGVFVAVLEQMVGADLQGPGWHPGCPFDNRGGMHPDTVALSAIPSAVKTYFTTTYPADTLLHAAITPDGTYILISKNKTLFATAITPAGVLVKRMQIDAEPAKHTPVLQTALPAAISTYLTATYPGYVFDKAFSASDSGGILGYAVFITSNTTKYVVQFTAAGVFVKAAVVR